MNPPLTPHEADLMAMLTATLIITAGVVVCIVENGWPWRTRK